MFPGVRGSLVSQDLDLSLLPLVFSLVLTVASRLLLLYSTDDKTFRLMLKSFSTVRDTWKGTQSYMEKERRRREREVARRKRGGIKRREIDPASNQVPKCSPSPEHTKRFTELGREEKGKGGYIGDLVEKKESQKREGAIKPVISLPSKNGY